MAVSGWSLSADTCHVVLGHYPVWKVGSQARPLRIGWIKYIWRAPLLSAGYLGIAAGHAVCGGQHGKLSAAVSDQLRKQD